MTGRPALAVGTFLAACTSSLGPATLFVGLMGVTVGPVYVMGFVLLQQSNESWSQPAVAASAANYLVVGTRDMSVDTSVAAIRVVIGSNSVAGGKFTVSTSGNGQDEPAVISTGTDYLVVFMDGRGIDTTGSGASMPSRRTWRPESSMVSPSITRSTTPRVIEGRVTSRCHTRGLP